MLEKDILINMLGIKISLIDIQPAVLGCLSRILATILMKPSRSRARESRLGKAWYNE